MKNCPHCGADTITTWQQMNAAQWSPHFCGNCGGAFYAHQPVIEAAFSFLVAPIALAAAVFSGMVGFWWVAPLILWGHMLFRSLFRFRGRIQDTMSFRMEKRYQRLREIGWWGLPVLAVLLFLLR